MTSITSKEYVTGNLLPQATAIAAKCGVSLTDFLPNPVHYMGQGIWELGFIPRQVTFTGSGIIANTVVLWHNERPVHNQHCALTNNVWERYPD